MTDEADPRSFRSITAAEARKKLDDGPVQIVDIRPPFDFAGGHIPRALNLPGRALRSRAAQLRLDRAILFVGSDGTETGEACALAVSLGFSSVMNLQGGFEAWLAAGYDIHTISDSLAC